MNDDSLVNQVLAGRYRVERVLGAGAMGRVFLAHHVHMQRRVAIKVLHPELCTVPEFAQRFEREAQAAAHIEHPHVARATDFGKLEDGRLYLVLEYVEGRPLSDVIAEGPLPLGRSLELASQIASALQEAHRRGIVHRDLKPDNLLLLSEEQQDHVKVLDFGIAKVPTEVTETAQPITRMGVVYGTPEYMAPEQALGESVDARADLYALGVILYEMLTGRRPYLGPSAGLLGQQLSHPLPKMQAVAKVRVPAAVEQLVVELLEPDPKRRLADAQEARCQLDALLLALAEGRLAGAEGRASTLLSAGLEEVTARIEHITRNIPQPVKAAVTSRGSRILLLAAGFGLFGVLATIALVGFLVTPPAPPVTPADGVVPAVSPTTNDDLELARETDPRLRHALELAHEGGSSDLIEVAAQFPNEGIVFAELALAYAKEHRYQDALDAVDDALTLDPKLNDNPKLRGALFRSAQASKTRSATFRVLTGPMGAAGVAIIYDLAHTEGVSAATTYLANKSLAKDEVVRHAAPSLALVLELERAKKAMKCEPTLAVVERAARLGDARALPLLEELGETTGCGSNGRADCFSCLRNDDVLARAIQSISQRAQVARGTQDQAEP